jgi:hypothetical protein
LIIALLLAWVIGFGIAAARSAGQHDRSIPRWAVFGAILGPGAMLLLQIAPPGRCHACRAPVRGWDSICRWCANDVRRRPTGARRAAAGAAPKTAAPAAAGPLRLAASPGMAAAASPPTGATAPTAAETRPPTPSGRQRSSRQADEDTTATGSEPYDELIRSIGSSVGAIRPANVGAPEPAPSATVDHGPPPTRIAVTKPAVAHPAVTLASGVYMTGSVGLEPGARYTLHVEDRRLRVLGPVDMNPTAIAREYRIERMDATGFNDRLVVSDASGRSSAVLVFISLGGGTPESVADEIVRLARAAGEIPA